MRVVRKPPANPVPVAARRHTEPAEIEKVCRRINQGRHIERGRGNRHERRDTHIASWRIGAAQGSVDSVDFGINRLNGVGVLCVWFRLVITVCDGVGPEIIGPLIAHHLVKYPARAVVAINIIAVHPRLIIGTWGPGQLHHAVARFKGRGNGCRRQIARRGGRRHVLLVTQLNLGQHQVRIKTLKRDIDKVVASATCRRERSIDMRFVGDIEVYLAHTVSTQCHSAGGGSQKIGGIHLIPRIRPGTV